jgi:hypothetical protein
MILLVWAIVKVDGVHHQKYSDFNGLHAIKDDEVISSHSESTYFAILRD